MGYKPPRKIYTLDFAGTEYDGLQVSMRGMTVGEELDMEGQSGPQLIKTVANLLTGWNIEDDHGQPVPANLDGLRAQEGAVALAIFDALRTAISGVPAPLPAGSPAGEPSPVASIPMETLSENPLSLPA